MPLISRDQKDLENTQTREITIKSVFMSEIYDLRQEISLVRSQLKQEKLHHSRNNHYAEEEENINVKSKAKLQ